LLPNYVSATDIKGISSPYIDEWTEGYPPNQASEHRSSVSETGPAIEGN
jgi:hypothetical protein